MPIRRIPSDNEQVAYPEQEGYLFRYWLPPLAVLFVGSLLTLFALTIPTYAASEDRTPHNFQADVASLSAPKMISPVFTDEVQYWAADIQKWAQAADLDPNLAATVMQIESCGDPQALSRSGAIGLFQVMPYHFTSSEDPWLPDTNARRGMGYLRRSWEAAGGQARLALAGYNGGIGVIGWSESDWPTQTKNYAYWGEGVYSDASSGVEESPRLQEWLNANGLYLCAQAHERLGINP